MARLAAFSPDTPTASRHSAGTCTPARTQARAVGFTLIELLVVMAIVALLASIAAPRYFRSVERAKENTLRTSLHVMRDAIDQHLADRRQYPASLHDLAELRYLREVPIDPLTGNNTSWVAVSPPPDAALRGGVADVRSGAAGRGLDGSLYADW